MTTTSRRFRMIVAVDSSPYAEVVLEQAFDQAARHDAPELHVLRVIDDRPRYGEPDPDEDDLVRRAVRDLVATKLDDFGRGPDTLGDWRVLLHVRHGRPAEEIVALAGEAEADLIVAGRFGASGRRRLLVGSVATRLLKLAPGPVLVVSLTDHEPSHTLPQCPSCVAVRAESAGERWFCDTHHRAHFGTSTLLLGHEDSGIRNGPMW